MPMFTPEQAAWMAFGFFITKPDCRIVIVEPDDLRLDQKVRPYLMDVLNRSPFTNETHVTSDGTIGMGREPRSWKIVFLTTRVPVEAFAGILAKAVMVVLNRPDRIPAEIKTTLSAALHCDDALQIEVDGP